MLMNHWVTKLLSVAAVILPLVVTTLQNEEVLVGLKNDGIIESTDFLDFDVILPPSVAAITPTMGIAGTTVTVKGNSFHPLMKCRFGEKDAVSRFVNSSILECNVPEDIPGGNTSLALLFYNTPISLGTPISFTLVMLSISSIQPSFGDSAGGTPVTLKVNDEAVDVVSHCIFGDQIVPAAKNHSTMTMQCRTPMQEAGSVHVGLSVNGEDFSMSSHIFNFTHPASFSSLKPSDGPELGGTVVKISGTNYVKSSDISCYFGNVKSSGQRVSDDEVSCVTPALRPGRYDLRLSFNGVDIIDTTLIYRAYLQMTALAAVPAFGVTTGGTHISVYGTNFRWENNLYCLFGDFGKVDATVVGSNIVKCVTPKRDNAGSVELAVVSGNGDVAKLDEWFEFYKPFQILSFRPNNGFLRGGTRVTVYGGHYFQTHGPIRCVFGGVSVEGRIEVDMQIQCTSPSSAVIGEVHVAISHGADEFKLDSSLFSYDIDIMIDESPVVVALSNLEKVLTVNGSFFKNTTELACRLMPSNITLDAIFVKDSLVECRIPEGVFPGEYELMVSNNGQDFSSTFLPLLVIDPFRVHSVHPSIQSLDLVTKLTIEGINFVELENLACIIDEQYVTQSHFISSTKIECNVPEDIPTGTVSVAVIHGDMSISIGPPLSVTFVELSISSIHPSFGDTNGGTPVTLKVNDEAVGIVSHCIFGDQSVPAVKIESSIQCTTPPMKVAGPVSIGVSFTNGKDFSISTHTFDFTYPASFTALTPSNGPDTGGIVVKIFGRYFVNSSHLVCYFGDSKVESQWISSDEISCVTPALRPGSYDLLVSLNGIDTLRTSMKFLSNYEIDILSVTPAMGSIHGGTILSIIGKSFVPMKFLSCRFGVYSKIVPAIFVSSTEISCVSPDISEYAGNATFIDVDVRVSLNGVDFSPATAHFQYSLPALIHSIHPVHGSVNGGTEVIVDGENFIPSTLPSCMFGKRSVPATVFSGGQMSCISTMHAYNETVPFSITLNGFDEVRADGAMKFTYLPTIQAISIEPNNGPIVGGTTVTVMGFDFDESLNIRCKFGSENVTATVVTDEKILCVSPSHPFGIVPFVLISEETDVKSNDAVIFEYYKPPQIISVYPNSGPHRGSTPVKVHGNFFRSTTKYFCHFGDVLVAGEFVTVDLVICLSPEFISSNFEDTHVELTITDRGANFTQESWSFSYVQPPTLLSLSPIHVFFEGGDSIVVLGYGFDSTEEVWCRFTNPLTSANVSTARASSVFGGEKVACITPSYPPTNVRTEVLVALSTNGYDWSTDILSIYYVPNLSITEVLPSLGSIDGGTLLTVYGTGFFEGNDLWCDFGAAGSVRAKLISYSKISCVTPSISSPRNVTVSLNFKGSGDYVSSDQSFAYHRQLSLVEAKPLRGFVGGATAVTIIGTGFFDVPSLSCRFGSIVVTAKIISRNMIKCVSPPAGEADKVNLSVSLNRIDFVSEFMSSKALFHYDPEVELHGASPKNVPIIVSNEANLTTNFEARYITLFGKGFINTTSLSCLFGSNQITSATIISESQVRCSLPEAADDFGEVDVSISMNGVDFSKQTSSILFVPPAAITDTYPRRVQEGSEIDIIISGNNFVQSPELECYFGSGGYIPKPARWISGSSLTCKSPPLNLTYDGFESLYISNNGGHDLSNSFPLGVIARSRFLSIQPNLGYTDGGTEVKITLSNMQYISKLSCQFGEDTISAELVSTNIIACVSPSHRASGIVTVKVFSDGIHLLAAGYFEYLNPPSISSLQPKMGLTEGGSIVSVSGNHVVGVTSCRFSVDKVSFKVTRAIVTNDTTVVCLVPSVERPIDALVQVSHNGQDFVGRELRFLYKERPRIFSIVPSYGSDSGGKRIHILGENFIEGAMMVHFEDSSVRASVISPKLISLIAPKLRLGQTSVSISAEGIDFVGNETLRYESIHLPQVSDIHPRIGIIGRHTQVVVSTTKLFKTDRLSCTFGDMTVAAVSTSPNAVSCVAPAIFDTTVVDLSISVDGECQLYAGGNHTRFAFVAEPRVLSAPPSIGWTTGGGRIFFEVEDMIPFYSYPISCIFGGSHNRVYATIDVENDIVFCIAPEFDRDTMEARAVIALMIDDGVNVIRIATREYIYLEPSIVTKIDPPFGSIRGGSAVKVTGINFAGMNGLDLNCLFGNVAVDAEIQDGSDVVACNSPEWSGGPKKTVVSVVIKNDRNIVIESHASFEYFMHPSITKIRPRFGSPIGGTAVIVTGKSLSWPDASKYLSCRFGDSSLVPATSMGEGLACVAPPLIGGASMVEGAVALNLTLYANHGNVLLDSSNELFIYTSGVKINSLSINSGPFTGGTDILISVTGFRGLPTDNITCIFGENESIGVYSKAGNDEFVKCTTPAVHIFKSSQTVLLRLGIDESDVISDGELFTFYSPPTLSSIFPSFGFIEGGEDVLITGTNFRNSLSLNCFFGDLPSLQSVWISDTSIICTSPLHQTEVTAPRVNVTVTNNGKDFTNTNGSSLAEYTYTHRPDVSIIEPSVMNEKNRTSIVIRGKSLTRVEACLFGIVKHKYRAYNVTENSVYCDVPLSVFEGPPHFVPLLLALANGVIATDLGIRYEAPPVIPETITQPILAAVEPRSGATAGGGWIKVKGEGFLSGKTLSCKFGEVLSPEVKFVSSSEIHCKVPKRLPGKVPFSVTNGGLESSSRIFEFTFVSDVSITAIFPSSGSVEGGTKTRIYGSFSSLMSAGIEPKCKFGMADSVRGVLVSRNEINCISPPASMVETVELRLSIDDGYNFVLSSSWFAYVQKSIVEALTPSHGNRSGGTPVLVTGRNFRNETGLSCKFGDTSVAASFISSEKATCIHPPHLSGTDDHVIFTLSSDSGMSTSWKHFEYVDDPSVTSIELSVRTSFGGAGVIVSGASFRNTTQLYCVFADINVRAVMIDTSTLLCEIPRHPSKKVTFRIVDRYDRALAISTGVLSQFEFVPQPSIEYVNINSNENTTRPQSILFARGSNFGNSGEMSCVFGDSDITKARVLAESILICETPQKRSTRMVNISIAHLGSKDSSQSLLSVGLDESSIAPNGTIMSHNVTSCKPGTFKPRRGNEACLPCPVGYICPRFGMLQPLKCSEGYICSELGLISPSSPCIAGHYCLEGTKSSYTMAKVEAEAWLLDEESGVPTAAMNRGLWDYIPRFSPATGFRRYFHPPVDREVRAQQPLPCPVSFFCRKGAKTPHHVNEDFSTPQKCFDGYFCPRGSIAPEGSGPCPEGHYCPDNVTSLLSAVIPLAIPCDVGHYCPGTGNIYPRVCSPGSYSPTKGRSTCMLCEVGRQCPEWGMIEPKLCEAGFVCDIEGISTPTKLCPGGYICEKGTSTDKPYTSSGVGPKPCPSGSACPSGTAHNITASWVSSFALGRVAPQPCAEGYHCPQNSSSIIGAGQCPPGHYCPPLTAVPIKVPPGTFAGEEGGAIAPSLCLPGTFSPQPGSVSCAKCPAGNSCLTYGTYIPLICDPGTYRSKEDSLMCKPCPRRTFSPHSGSTDVSQCLPCPEGLVCGTKGMSDIGLSLNCPEGHYCGYLTDRSAQYNHKCAAGQYCGELTTTSNQYNADCLAGNYCERGTVETMRKKNECNIGYYCLYGTPSPEPINTRCPRQTKSLLGSDSMSLCLPESVTLCDKISYIQSNPFNRISYYPLDESADKMAVGREKAVVQKILPFNQQRSNTEPWKNETVEVIRACPIYVVHPGWTPKPAYGVRAEDLNDKFKQESITIVGRNFRNSTTLTCRYRTCLSSSWKNDEGVEIVVPGRCFSDLAGSQLSEAETRNGTFISDSRILCPLPNTKIQGKIRPVNESNANAEGMYSQILCLHDEKGRTYLSQKCSDAEAASGRCSRDDLVPASGFRRRLYSLVVPCSITETSLGHCANVPSPTLKLNPCFTSQVIIDVSNNGEKFSSVNASVPYSLVASNENNPTEFKQPPTYATYYVIDDDVLVAFESENNVINMKHLISSVKSDESQCNLVSSHEEGRRLDNEGWFEAAYMNRFHLSFDWRLLPKYLVYDEHFRLAIYVFPSRCQESKCSDSNRQIRSTENIPCLQPVQLPKWFTDASIDKNQITNITLLSFDDARFRVEVQLMNGLALPFADFFERTMTVIKEQPQRAKSDFSASRGLSPLISWEERIVEMPWIFGIRYDESYSHTISLPLNLPPRWKSWERGRVLLGMNTTHENIAPTIKDSALDKEQRRDFWSNPYQSELIAKEQTDLFFETFHGISVDQSTGSYRFDLNSLILPYLPYFSNCREFDSHIPLWALLESSSQCKLPKISPQYPDTWWRRQVQALPHQDDVKAIGPSDFIKFYPVADWCERKLHCSFEESLSSTDVTPRWFEADSGSTLFSIIRDPIDYYQYTGRDASTVGANDGGGQRFINTVKTRETFIPAKVLRSPAFNVEGDCTAACFPRRVTVDISYYQLDVSTKRVVQVNLIYDKFDKDTTNNRYELQFKFYPLNYQELVTKFAFTRGLFLSLFSYIGIGTVVVSLVYWTVIRLTTSLESPPHLRVFGYLWLTFPPAFGGLLLGLIPVSIVTAASFYLVNGYRIVNPDSDPDGRRWLFTSTRLQYSDINIDPDLLRVTRQGRTGLAFITMAIASLYFTTKVFVPQKDSNESQSGVCATGDATPFAMQKWKRSNMLVSSILMSLFLVGIVEWSFWDLFGTYIWEAKILMKCLGIVIGQVMDKQMGEALLSAPIMTAFGLVQSVVTMSANDFMDFLLSYIVGYGFLILERMYIGPLLSSILKWIDSLFAAVAQSVRYLLATFVMRNPSSLNDAEASAVLEENGETLEPLLGSYTSYSCDIVTLMYFPYIMIVIMIFRDEAEMMKLYHIKESDMEYYVLFALVVIPFQITADIFLHNALELLHGWKTYEYIEYCRVRFLQREMWWKGLETNTLDECINESLRSIDQMCFSSQYYMLNTLHVNAIIYLVLGIVMMARAKYNAFGDPAMSSIVTIVLLCSIVVKIVLTHVAKFFGLWSIRYEKRRWHQRIQSDGEPKIEQWSNGQTTAHSEYKLEEKMISDTFRYKFLRYNRSWIIDQLPSMLNDREASKSRPYVINQLARILGSIDADISSDDSEGDDAPEFETPLMNASTRAMLRTWFGEASRLLRLSRLVEPIIQKSRGDVCQFCLSRGLLRVETCYPVEEMNRLFIEEYPDCKDEIDQVLWKRFWQRNQKYQTICFPCLQRRSHEKRESIIVDDRSSDDADSSIGDLTTNELDVVSAAILSTWYSKAKISLNRE